MPTHFTDQKKGHPTKELIELSDPFFGEIPSSQEYQLGSVYLGDPQEVRHATKNKHLYSPGMQRVAYGFRKNAASVPHSKTKSERSVAKVIVPSHLGPCRSPFKSEVASQIVSPHIKLSQSSLRSRKQLHPVKMEDERRFQMGRPEPDLSGIDIQMEGSSDSNRDVNNEEFQYELAGRQPLVPSELSSEARSQRANQSQMREYYQESSQRSHHLSVLPDPEPLESEEEEVDADDDSPDSMAPSDCNELSPEPSDEGEGDSIHSSASLGLPDSYYDQFDSDYNPGSAENQDFECYKDRTRADKKAQVFDDYDAGEDADSSQKVEDLTSILQVDDNCPQTARDEESEDYYDAAKGLSQEPANIPVPTIDETLEEEKEPPRAQPIRNRRVLHLSQSDGSDDWPAYSGQHQPGQVQQCTQYPSCERMPARGADRSVSHSTHMQAESMQSHSPNVSHDILMLNEEPMPHAAPSIPIQQPDEFSPLNIEEAGRQRRLREMNEPIYNSAQDHPRQAQFSDLHFQMAEVQDDEEAMEGIVMSQLAHEPEQDDLALPSNSGKRVMAIERLIENGTGVHLAEDMVAYRNESEREAAEYKNDTELSMMIAECDVTQGTIGQVDKMMGQQMDTCPYMDAAGIHKHGVSKRLATSVIIDSFAFESYPKIKREWTAVRDDAGDVIEWVEDRLTGPFREHFLNHGIRLKTINRQVNRSPAAQRFTHTNHNVRYFCQLSDEQQPLTHDILHDLQAALLAMENEEECGMLLSIDVTIDMFGFFYRTDLLDWQLMAEVVARAFRVHSSDLTAGDVRQTNTMLQFVYAVYGADPQMPRVKQKQFRLKVYNKIYQRIMQCAVTGPKLDNGIRSLLQPKPWPEKVYLDAQHSGLARCESSHYFYNRAQSAAWMGVDSNRRILGTRSLALSLFECMITNHMLYQCSIAKMLSSFFNGAEKNDMRCFNESTTMILMRHSVIVIYAYNMRFYKFVGKQFPVERTHLNIPLLMQAYSIPGLPVRVYDCTPEDRNAARPQIYPAIQDRDQMLLFGGAWMESFPRANRILEWPSFFTRELIVVEQPAISFDDVHPCANHHLGNAPVTNVHDENPRCYYGCPGCHQAIRADHFHDDRHPCFKSGRFDDVPEWKGKFVNSRRTCPHCFRTMSMSRIASHIRTHHWRADQVNKLYCDLSEAQANEWQRAIAADPNVALPRVPPTQPGFMAVSVVAQRRAEQYEVYRLEKEQQAARRLRNAQVAAASR